jgi:hypothetical protein
MKETHLPDATACMCSTFRHRLCLCFLAGLTVFVSANTAAAATITFGCLTTQSTQDGTGPAVNNLSQNNIKDGQASISRGNKCAPFVTLALVGRFSKLFEGAGG